MTTIILYAPQGASSDQVRQVEALAEELAARSYRVLLTPDLYDAPDASPLWQTLRDLEGPVAVLGWLHPRALRWLLHRRGTAGAFCCLVNLSTSATLEAVVANLPPARGASGAVERVGEESGKRWYPVVDLSRCTNCGHCLQFCRFGVYEYDLAGHVRVTQPDHCKHGCPACSRVCPTGAIIFPRYDKDPAIAGADGLLVKRNPKSLQKLYTRLGRPCPLCTGKTDTAAAALGDEGFCPECGRGPLE